ncbi:MAG: thioesterase domain-containing protein [Gammaproteobacteria bacterium]
MRAAGLLAELRELDVEVELEGDRLHLKAPKGALTDDHRRQLREHKSEIVEFLREAREHARQQRAIVPLKATGTRVPIFAVGGHNGDVFCFYWLIQHLDPEQPFYGLQPPGLEEGSDPCTSIASLAGYFADQIRAFLPRGPVVLAGYCASGTIAFELARQLQASGTTVRGLILFGAPYPTYYCFLPRYVAHCADFVRGKMVHLRRLRGRSASEWRSDLAGSARARFSGIRRASHDSVMARRHVVEKATFAALRRYRPPAAFDGRVALMLPNESWKHSLAQPLRWRHHLTGAMEFTGPNGCGCNTYTMFLPEHAATFAAFINSALGYPPAETARKDAAAIHRSA